MPYEFGNIFGMNKEEFQKAIDYYQNKIEMMTNDETITPGVKRWFLKRYTQRINKLNKAYQKLQTTINEIQARGGYVNENIATLNSLNGTSKIDRRVFKNLGISNTRHVFGQILRTFALFIPVVGTIPAAIGIYRSKHRHKIRAQEDIEMNNFVNNTNRSHDAALGTSTPFTEQEMQSLLEHPNEITRLISLTLPLSTVLNPVQKKNLIAKLSALKEYGQKNGYSVSALADSKFDTSQDKAAKTLFSITSADPASLKEAHEKVTRLKNLKNQVEALLDSDKENSNLKTLITNIDSKITTYTARATTFVNDATSQINANLDAATTSSNAKADLETSNTNLDNAYNAVNAKLGENLSVAKTLAAELGISTSKFDELTSKHTNHKSANNSKLEIIKKRENCDNELNNVETILNEVESATITTPVNAADAQSRLAVAESIFNKYKDYALNLPAGDAVGDRYKILHTKYGNVKAKIEEKQADINIDSSNFNDFKTIIANNQPKLSVPYNPASDDNSIVLAAKKAQLNYALEKLKDPELQTKFASSSRNSELLEEIQKATDAIAAIDNALETISKEESKKAIETKLKPFKTRLSANLYNTSDSLTLFKSKKSTLEAIINAVDKAEFKAGIEDQVDAFVVEVKEQLNLINTELASCEKLETLIEKHSKKIDTICKPNRRKAVEISEVDYIQSAHDELETYRSIAVRWGIENKIDSAVNKAKGFLDHYKASVKSKETKTITRT